MERHVPTKLVGTSTQSTVGMGRHVPTKLVGTSTQAGVGMGGVAKLETAGLNMVFVSLDFLARARTHITSDSSTNHDLA